MNDTDWQIDFETTLVNVGYDDAAVKVESSVIDPDGNVVAIGIGEGVIPQRDKATLKYSTVVVDPKLWDCDEPNLYKVKSTVFMNGEAIDEDNTRIGFRTVEITVENGFLLNGKKTYINGVCAHQDFGLTGIAVPDNIAKYKIALIKEMGANGYRTSHYQQTTAYMDALDEMGFLVLDEARWFDSTEDSLMQIESLVKRDRNRPSVIFWSTSNEEPNHITDNGRRIHKAISAHIRKLDRTRYITAAQDKTPEASTIYDECDLIGINYNLNLYDTVHEMRPDKPVFASECCATGTTRDWNFDTDSPFRMRDKDTVPFEWFMSREKTWKALKSKPYVFGGYQ
jgi:beta-galactosidase